MVDIDLIIAALDIELNHTYRIISIQDANDNYMINCPYHDDRSPSFGILKEDKHSHGKYVKAGHGHCFACGASASLPSLISHMFGYEGDEFGANWLLERFNITGSEQVSFKKVDKTIGTPRIIEYEKYETYHPYMAQRGLNEATAKVFHLGINPATNSLVMPVFDKFGTCRMTIERGLTEKRFYNTSGVYKEDLLFGLYQYYKYLGNHDTVYLVESAIDAMRLWQNGKIAVAIMQASPTQEQLDLLFNMYTTKIVVATDNDEAGERAVQPIVDYPSDKRIYRIVFPSGTKDVGDFSDEQIRGIQLVEKTKLRSTKKVRRNPFEIKT